MALGNWITYPPEVICKGNVVPVAWGRMHSAVVGSVMVIVVSNVTGSTHGYLELTNTEKSGAKNCPDNVMVTLPSVGQSDVQTNCGTPDDVSLDGGPHPDTEKMTGTMGYEYVTNDRATTRALGSHKERNKSFMTRLAVTLKLVKGRGVQMSHVVAYCWSTQGTNGVLSVSLVGFLTHIHKH